MTEDDLRFLQDDLADEEIGPTGHDTISGSGSIMASGYSAELSATEGAAKELYLAACIMSRPEWFPKLQIDPTALMNVAAKAVLKVIDIEGPAYANPNAMKTAIMDLPEEVDPDELYAIFEFLPDPASLNYEDVEAIKEQIIRTNQNRFFIGAVEQSVQKVVRLAAQGRLSEEAVNELSAKLREQLEQHQRGIRKVDATAGGILGRMRTKPPKVRWRCGNEELDMAFKGIDQNGKPGYGMLGQKEVLVMIGVPGTGKTREVLNWVPPLLDQGASISVLALEDDEGTFAAKIMAAKFDVEFWRIEQWLFFGGKIAFVDMGKFGALDLETGKYVQLPYEALSELEAAGYVLWQDFEAAEAVRRCYDAEHWMVALGDRLRIYDAEENNIFSFRTAYSLLVSDAASYDTTHTIIDYVTAWTGETKDLAGYAFALREYAARYDVNVIEIAQMTKESQKWGTVDGVVDVKGAAEWGQAAHIALEIQRDVEVGDEEFRIKVQKARNAGRRSAYVSYNLETGRVLRYTGTPVADGWTNNSGKKPSKGRR